MNIRTRLLLLVIVVWLPAAVAIGLLAWSTYLREVASARESIRQAAQQLNRATEREIDLRRQLARMLATSDAVRQRDLERFREEARAGITDPHSQAGLFDLDGRRLDEPGAPDALPGPLPGPRASPPGSDHEPIVFFRGDGPAGPQVEILVAEAVVHPPRQQVRVSFEPAVLQALLPSVELPADGVVTVMDDQQRVVARSRDPARWLGQSATGDLKARALREEEGFAESVTLDGVPSLTYLSPPNRHGWAAVIALPRAELAAAAWRVTLQAAAASFVLLLLGLAAALWGSRRISEPLLRLRDAAIELGEDRVPPAMRTGVSEADEVSLALHEAGLRSRDATRMLEARVAQAVDQVREAQARLFEAQKHEVIGRLTGGIAHDFNNLLQTIRIALNVLERSSGAEGPQRRMLQAALGATAKAANLIRQLLTFGRAQPLNPQPVDLRDLLLKSQELTAKALGERVVLSADLQPGLPPLFVDPVQLELALLNLVFNARDAMPEGGRVTITARPAHGDETAALSSGRGYLRIDVRDNGQGMDERTAARVFDPYFTTKPAGVGTGLGLPQAQAFAKQSGGDIALQTRLGEGTCVSLLLPACDAGTDAAEASTAPSRAAGRPLRLLMVEDDVLISSVLVPALEREGHRVTRCATADEAMQRLDAADDDEFDLLFTDIVMPGRLSGTELVAWCRARHPGLPAIIATGYSAQLAEEPARVLRKPYGIDELLAAMQDATEAPPGDETPLRRRA